MALLVGRTDIGAFSANGFAGFGSGSVSTIAHVAAVDGVATSINTNFTQFGDNAFFRVVIYSRVIGVGNWVRFLTQDVTPAPAPQNTALPGPLTVPAGTEYLFTFYGNVSSVQGNEVGHQIPIDPLIVAPDGVGSLNSDINSIPDPLGFYGREVDGEYFWNIDGTPAPSISGTTGTIAPGEQVTVSTSQLGTITSVTYNGLALAINSTAADQVTVTFPASMDMNWGASYDLIVSDGSQSVTGSYVLNPEAGFDYVNLSIVPDSAATDSLAELAANTVINNVVVFPGYVPASGQQFQFSTDSALTVNDQTIVFVNPPQSLTGTYRVRYNDADTPRYIESQFTVGPLDNSPAIFEFTDVVDQMAGNSVNSEILTLSGFNTPIPVSVFGGLYAINSGPLTAAEGTLNPGDTVQLRATTAATYPGAQQVTFTAGGISDQWTVANYDELPDGVPDDFDFDEVTNAPLNSLVVSNSIQVQGINEPTSIEVIDGDAYSINDGPFVNVAGTINPGDSFRIRIATGGDFDSEYAGLLDIGGVQGEFSVTTEVEDTLPNVFVFPPVTGANQGQSYLSDEVVITGFNSTAPVSIVDGEYSINGGAFTAQAGQILPEQRLRVRRSTLEVSGTRYRTTVDVGGVTANFDVTTAGLPPQDPEFNGPIPNQDAVLGFDVIVSVASYFSDPDSLETFSSVGAALPPGLTLTPQGLINGAATTAGVYPGIVIRASGSVGDTPVDSNSFTITVSRSSIIMRLTNNQSERTIENEDREPLNYVFPKASFIYGIPAKVRELTDVNVNDGVFDIRFSTDQTIQEGATGNLLLLDESGNNGYGYKCLVTGVTAEELA